eukprot:2083497-Heterocapsa_arctica.AAC.1
MSFQGRLAGSAWDDRALHAASPRHAFEKELGPQTIVGMFFQDRLIGPAWDDRALYAAPPRHAFENELGMQA